MTGTERDFWRANPPTRNKFSCAFTPLEFHYTDVPVVRPNDIVTEMPGAANGTSYMIHAIGGCGGTVPERNERRITKPVAIILLAHYVADIHQPLHAGTEYFRSADSTDPAKDKSALGD